MEEAQCRVEDAPEVWFFPEEGGRYSYARGKEVCARCPVRSECLLYCLKTEDPDYRFGLFGGKTPGERYAL